MTYTPHSSGTLHPEALGAKFDPRGEVGSWDAFCPLKTKSSPLSENFPSRIILIVKTGLCLYMHIYVHLVTKVNYGAICLQL
jgi:hypothetical protein